MTSTLKLAFYQNEGAEWRILVPGCVDFLGRMWTARLSACLSVCLSVRLGGSRAADPPFAWERGKGEPSDPPSDPPQRRPTPATHPRSYRHVAGVRYISNSLKHISKSLNKLSKSLKPFQNH